MKNLSYKKQKNKFVLIGKSLFSYLILKRMIKLKIQICGVITLKSKDDNDDFFDLSKICRQKKIPLHKTNNINNLKSVKWVIDKKPNFIFCFGWSQLIKGKLVKVYKNKIIGFHPTKLPNNRGRSPLIWSILLNIKKSAITFFYINKGVDDGKLIDQSDFFISNNETSKSIYSKICKLALKRIPILIDKINRGFYLKTKKKNQNNSGNIWRKRVYSDGIIDWRMTSKNITELINALGKPYCGASLIFNNKDYKVWSAKIVRSDKKFNNHEYGKIIKRKKDSYVVKSIDGLVEIKNIIPKLSLPEGNYLK